jgi:hypothetical protein
VVVLILGAVVFLSMGFVRLVRVPTVSERNNPQDFYLWSTSNSFDYTFRYDPRAADIWAFKSGGHARFVLHDATKPPDK